MLKNKETEFYKSLEEPIREVVKVLRDNGFNTESSCGHKMSVQIQLFPDGQLKDLHDLIFCYLHEKSMPINYTIEARMTVMNGHMYHSLNITFGKPKI